jgi:hypothetical protein
VGGTVGKHYNLNEAFAYYTECQLATLEGAKIKKSTPKSEIRRHLAIARGMVDACIRYDVKPPVDFGRGCPRLKNLLDNGYNSETLE